MVENVGPEGGLACSKVAICHSVFLVQHVMLFKIGKVELRAHYGYIGVDNAGQS